jgi:hypothetical protein
MKEAYYFSHDSNARHDPKILLLRSVYGSEGYGWYWILVETLREQADFTLDKQGKYSFNALALQMHCNKDTAEKFVNDCIEEFELFDTDGDKFWSNSLLRRMAMKEELSQKRKKAAEQRWSKKEEDTNDMQKDSISNADGMQGKEKKENKKKKVNKNKYADYVSMTLEEYQKLQVQFGEDGTKERVEELNLYKGSAGKKYNSDYLTILNWEKKNQSTKKKIDWEEI